MDRAQFELLVSRMEVIAITRPAAYRRRVFALAALGYGYLALVVLGLVVLTGLAIGSVVYLKVVGVKLALVVGALLFAVLRSLWVKQQAPEGEQITAADAPLLFSLLADLRQRLNTEPIHTVLVMPDLNAAIAQVPRLGIFGWHRNYLLLGLPLMKSLSVEQFKAVVAHELGHLSGGHARAGNWIYRMRVIWSRLETTFEQQRHWGSGVIQLFLKWYIPYFSAVSFPFARGNEYAADAAAVQLTSAQHVAQALTNVHMIEHYLSHKYWPGIHSAANDTPAPAFAPYSHFSAQAVHDVAADDLERWHAAGLNQMTLHQDTHPCLGDRLRAIGRAADFKPPGPGQSADQLLGDALGMLESTFDARWRRLVADSWRRKHDETQVKRVRLAELRAAATSQELNEEAALELVWLEETVGEPAAVAPLVRETVRRFPDSAAVRFVFARYLLLSGDRSGVGMMEGVLRDDSSVVIGGSLLLRDYFVQLGDQVAAKAWNDRYVDESRRLRGAEQERRRILLSDRFLPHELDAAELTALKARLRSIVGIKRVYLVRKGGPLTLDVPLYVLGYKVTGMFQLHSKKRAGRVGQAILDNATLPEPVVVINVDAKFYKFARKMRRIKHSKLI